MYIVKPIYIYNATGYELWHDQWIVKLFSWFSLIYSFSQTVVGSGIHPTNGI